MSDDDAFLAGIRDAPWDLLRQSVYADWLDEHDRPFEAAVRRAVPLKCSWARDSRLTMAIGAKYLTGGMPPPMADGRRLNVTSSLYCLTEDDVEPAMGTTIRALAAWCPGDQSAYLADLQPRGYRPLACGGGFDVFLVSSGVFRSFQEPCHRCKTRGAHGYIGSFTGESLPTCRFCYREIFPDTKAIF